MELQGKHIISYLRFGTVKAEVLNYKCDYVGLQWVELNGFYMLGDTIHFTYKGGGTSKSLKELKPVLRHIDDMLCEIEYKGEKFMPYDKLKTVVTEEQWVSICNTINEDYNKVCDMPNWWVDILVEWGFDIFGLIEEGYVHNIKDLNGVV